MSDLKKNMDLTEMIKHHNWANSKYLGYIRSLDKAMYTKPLPNSDKSIHYLIYHLYEVMYGWFDCTINGEEWELPDEDQPTTDLMSQIELIQQNIYVFSQNEDLDRDIIIQWDKNDKPVTSSPRKILFNFVTHSAYHRGQLALLLRAHGFEGIEETDYNPYIYNLAQQ